MIKIEKNLCIGCSKCVRDCFPGALTLQDGSPVLEYPDRCLSCGHCIAVCPRKAVWDDELNMDESYEIVPEKTPDNLLLSMQFRRSCRHYTSQKVSEAELQTLLSAARACPTAKNLQGTRYIAVTEAIPHLLDAALEGLGQLGESQLSTATEPSELRRARNFVSWAQIRSTNKSFDPLFFHAPLLLMFVTEGDPRDAAAAAAYTELMAYHLGLGCLYSGYFTACAAGSKTIQNMLHLKPGESVVRCLVLGHPDIHFQRTAPRRTVDLTRL